MQKDASDFLLSVVPAPDNKSPIRLGDRATVDAIVRQFVDRCLDLFRLVIAGSVSQSEATELIGDYAAVLNDVFLGQRHLDSVEVDPWHGHDGLGASLDRAMALDGETDDAVRILFIRLATETMQMLGRTGDDGAVHLDKAIQMTTAKLTPPS